MSYRRDLTGQKYGKLTAVEFAGVRSGKTLWRCECDCGAETLVTIGNWGKTKSCGCLNAKMGYGRLPGESARMQILRGYQNGAKRRGYSWDLTEEDFDRLTSGDCFYCGLPPSAIHRSGKNGKFVYNGIDRVENDYGYLKTNVVTCCAMCNKAKSSMSVSEFILWIIRVHNHCEQVAEAYSEWKDEEELDGDAPGPVQLGPGRLPADGEERPPDV